MAATTETRRGGVGWLLIPLVFIAAWQAGLLFSTAVLPVDHHAVERHGVDARVAVRALELSTERHRWDRCRGRRWYVIMPIPEDFGYGGGKCAGAVYAPGRELPITALVKNCGDWERAALRDGCRDPMRKYHPAWWGREGEDAVR